MRKLILFCTLCLVAVLPVSAGTILIYNTGVDAAFAPLLAGAADTHWQCSVNCSGNAFQAVGATPAEHTSFPTAPTGWPVPSTQNSPNAGTGPWVASALNGSSVPVSQWIASQSDVTALTGALEYDFTQTFTILASLNASTADIAGNFAADNNIIGIYVNGTLVTGTASTGTLSSKTGFDLRNGVNGVLFNTGSNTVTFKVQNALTGNPNPSGLLVEFTSATAADVAVPEPTTLFGVGLGLSLLGLIARRRRA